MAILALWGPTSRWVFYHLWPQSRHVLPFWGHAICKTPSLWVSAPEFAYTNAPGSRLRFAYANHSPHPAYGLACTNGPAAWAPVALGLAFTNGPAFGQPSSLACQGRSGLAAWPQGTPELAFTNRSAFSRPRSLAYLGTSGPAAWQWGAPGLGRMVKIGQECRESRGGGGGARFWTPTTPPPQLTVGWRPLGGLAGGSGRGKWGEGGAWRGLVGGAGAPGGSVGGGC